jgi:hypothetical protein
MEYYALRHVLTQRFMPAHISRGSSRGYTCWEPYDLPSRYATPRLFTSKRGAQQARAAWAKGRHVRSYANTDSFCDGEIIVVEDPIEPRSKDDFELVRVTLLENGQ